MRLDHLLSKEEEVGRRCVLLLGYQAVSALETKVSRSRLRRLYILKKSLMETSFQRDFVMMCTYSGNAKILVAMRLGDTPVPIPNTMVKT